MSSPEKMLPPTRPGALATFLQGIERRAWVLALAQCGASAAAQTALATAIDEFAEQAPAQPLADWPLLFWQALLRQPPLLAELPADQALARLPPGPRAALLLRLVAGLDFEPAARVLQVSRAAYEAALRAGLARPGMDDAGIQALREHLHAQIQDMPAAQREALAELRNRRLAPLADAGQAAPEAAAPGSLRQARLGLPLWIALGVLLLVLLASYLRPSGGFRPADGDGNLPVEAIAPAPGLSDTVVVTHPDYAQLAAPADDVLARQLDLLSWIAAGGPPLQRPQLPAPVAPAPIGLAQLSAPERELLQSAISAWPGLEPETRASLHANAGHWLGLSTAGRAQLRQRLGAWDRQLPLDRARRRMQFAAWQALDAADQQWVRLAATRFAGLTEPERALLREQFAGAPEDTRRLWWLGPSLGQELAPIASLFAFLPETDRPLLLEALGSLDAGARADLSVLASRMSEAQRQALRRDLLAAPAEQRAGLIRQRLAR